MKRWFGKYVAMLRDIGRARAPVVVNLEENLWAFTEGTRRPPAQIDVVGATFDLAFYEARDESDDVLTHELAAGQLTFLRAFGAATRLRSLLGGIPPSEIDWYLGHDGLVPALNAGVLGMLVSAPQRTAAEVERYRTAVARYAAAPARLSNRRPSGCPPATGC